MAAGPAVLANEAGARDGSCTLAREMCFCGRTKQAGGTKVCVDRVLSGAGRPVVEKVGCFRVR